MEIFTIPRGEKVEKVAISLHPLQFFIENYGNLNGIVDPASPGGVSLYDLEGMADIDAVSRLSPAKRSSRSTSPQEGLNFISLLERWDSKNDGVVMVPFSLSAEAVQVVINHVHENASDLHGITDRMHLVLNTQRGNVNINVSGVSKLVAVRALGKTFNYSIIQPDSQTVEGYMERSVTLMQYLIDNRDTFQDDMEYWGVKGKELKKMVGLYLKNDKNTKLKSFKGELRETGLIRLVHSYLGKEERSNWFESVGSDFNQVFARSIERFNRHLSPFRERTLRLVLTALVGKLARVKDDYSEVELVDRRILSNPNLSNIVRGVGINQQFVTQILNSINCVKVLSRRTDVDGPFDEYKVIFTPSVLDVNSPVDERCEGCRKFEKCLAAKDRQDAWIKSKSNSNRGVRRSAHTYFADLDKYLSGDGNELKIVIL